MEIGQSRARTSEMAVWENFRSAARFCRGRNRRKHRPKHQRERRRERGMGSKNKQRKEKETLTKTNSHNFQFPTYDCAVDSVLPGALTVLTALSAPTPPTLRIPPTLLTPKRKFPFQMQISRFPNFQISNFTLALLSLVRSTWSS